MLINITDGTEDIRVFVSSCEKGPRTAGSALFPTTAFCLTRKHEDTKVLGFPYSLTALTPYRLSLCLTRRREDHEGNAPWCPL